MSLELGRELDCILRDENVSPRWGQSKHLARWILMIGFALDFLAGHRRSAADNNTPQGYFPTESSAVEWCKVMADNVAFVCVCVCVCVLICICCPGTWMCLVLLPGMNRPWSRTSEYKLLHNNFYQVHSLLSNRLLGSFFIMGKFSVVHGYLLLKKF